MSFAFPSNFPNIISSPLICISILRLRSLSLPILLHHHFSGYNFSIIFLYQIGSFTTRILIWSCSISFSSTSTNKENYIAEIKCLVNKRLILTFGENRSFYSPALLNTYNLIINFSSNFLYTQTGETVFRRPYGPRSSW